MKLILLLRLFRKLFLYEIKLLLSINMGINFCKDLLITATGTSSPHIGGANAIEIIFNDV